MSWFTVRRPAVVSAGVFAAVALLAGIVPLGPDAAPAADRRAVPARPVPADPRPPLVLAGLHERRTAVVTTAQQRFEALFPAQAAAVQDPGDAASTRWAVLVGVNDHAGRTRDNVGSRQDAEDLAAHLQGLGWRADHIVLLTDRDATHENLTEALAWLARKTDQHSVAVFHYSGHVKQWHGVDVDGDGEVPDEGLWPSDNRHLPDGEFVDRLGLVGAGRLWVNIGGCEAAGFDDPGLRQAGRLLTFSSREVEKSYEDPPAANSVWGRFLLEGLAGIADADGDADVTVQEAFAYAAPLATDRSSIGAYGPQHPVIVDDLGVGFSLRITEGNGGTDG